MRSNRNRPRIRLRTLVVRTIAALVLMGVAFVGWRMAIANFGTIEPGRLYRSGQMSANQIARAIRDHEIKTVLNLRGQNPDQPWYRAERNAVLGAGATQVDIAMSSCEWMSRDQARTILEVLETSEYPLLIHCQWGAERTGLVSAFAELLRPGGSLANAQAQFSLWYLFVRIKDGAVMAEHLDQYQAWLDRYGLAHTPDHFRRWIAESYHPAGSSREQWPYDPYPLVVVTRP